MTSRRSAAGTGGRAGSGRRSATAWRVVLPVALAAAVLPAVSTATAQESAAPADAVTLQVLSNRADLVSGGDALVHVGLPDVTDAEGLEVTLNGEDVSDRFALRADGRVLGRVEGMPSGRNVLQARTSDGEGAELVVTNHAVGGPVFSGPQLQPWLCTTASAGLGAPVDAQCNAPTLVQYLYRPTGSSSLSAYDPKDPPSDVSTITTDEGRTVPYIVRQETGTQNRGIYRLAVLHDPSKPFEPWDRDQQGWNRKLYYPFGASCGTAYTQGSAQNVQNTNALSKGFMVATSSLNVTGSNCNTVLQAETVMMLKEHIVDRFGEIRYTFGNGSSGGAIGQNMVANSYPGLLQGLTVGASYADTMSTGAEVFDCHNLVQYFTRTSPHLWANPAQQTAVTGHGTSPGTCAGWEVLFSSVLDPTTGCGLPAAQTYNATTNPGGARCTIQDYDRNIYGFRAEPLWTAPEKRIGTGFANGIYGNVGIQYGLKALQRGQITTEQFVDLNEKIGSFDIDFQPTRTRSVATGGATGTAYRSGRLNDGSQLDQVAIIDSRGIGNVDPLLIHTMHHSFALKERMRIANGSADNHAVWRGGQPADPFTVMDAWLTAVEKDTSGAPLAERIVRNKPAEAVDMCFVGGQRLTDRGACDAAWPYYGAPRSVAGLGITHDNLECALKPLDRTDDYGPVPFLDSQWARLTTAFPTGVCDYSKPSPAQAGVGPSVPWLSYAEGPGGVPVGPAPTSTRR